MTIQLHRLEGFYWVARTGGFTAAARAFPYPITQPGVYQQVRRLEEEMGAALCERSTRDRVRLTPAGERLFAFCAPFFEMLPSVVQSLGDEARGGTLRVDASGLALRQLLPAWVRALKRARPDYVVEMEEVQVPELDRLRSGAADVIVDHFTRVPTGFASKVVATAKSYVVLPRAHGVARGAPTPSELRQLPLVSYHPSLPQHAAQMAAVRKHIGEPARTVSASSADSILAFVEAGLGYSVVPWIDPRGPRGTGIQAFLQRGRRTEHPVLAVWRKANPPNNAVALLLGALPDAPAQED
jgi:DNA-binding transcriptional LysR family regulator